MFADCFLPGFIGAEARCATNGGVLAGDLPIQEFLCGGIIGDLFVSQKGDQSFLQGSKAAFNFPFGLRAWCNEVSHTQSRKGALKFRTRIVVVGGGSVAKKAQAIGIDRQRQLVMKKEMAEMLEVVPCRVGGNKAGVEQLSGMIIDGEQECLLLCCAPPLVNG